MSEYKVEVKDLCKNFGSLEVLKNCNFNIKRGEFVCVVGPTGCGKTTFLNTLTCLIPPTSSSTANRLTRRSTTCPSCSRNRRQCPGLP